MKLGMSGEGYHFLVTAFVIIPSTCFLKGHISFLSRKFDEKLSFVRRFLFFRVEEFILMAVLAGGLYNIYTETGKSWDKVPRCPHPIKLARHVNLRTLCSGAISTSRGTGELGRANGA